MATEINRKLNLNGSRWLGAAIFKRPFEEISPGIAEALPAILHTLELKEILILTLRFGLSSPSDNGLTQQVVGDILGVSKERIRQIEQRALRRLRHYTRSRQLRQYIKPKAFNG